LADHFLNIEAVVNATAEDLTKVSDIGPKVAASIIEAFENPKLKKEIQLMQKYGVDIQNPTRSHEGPLSGLSFVITGTLPVHRDEAKDMIEKNGGKTLSSVSKKLDFLVVGADAGSKAEKAQALGVKMISWEELLEKIKGA
jgi:DNA ligase (NAD+)